MSAAQRVSAEVLSGVRAHGRRWLGGCRPLSLVEFLETSAWRVSFHAIVTQVFLTSEVTIAIVEK